MRQSGQRIREYVLEKRLGGGAVGEVWLARHELLNKKFAVKAIYQQLFQAPRFKDRFLRVGAAQAKLEHPNIVRVTDFFIEDESAYLVMQYVDGGSLDERIEHNKQGMPVDDVLGISRDVLAGLDYAHRNGVIHRDVKPSNIMLERGDGAYLSDFDIALVMGRSRQTEAGVSLGTPYYMSPEQIRRPRDVDQRTDVYSFGCVLFEMLCGRPPFVADPADGDPGFALKTSHVKELAPPLRHFKPGIDARLETAVLRALAKDPGERYFGCQEFAAALGPSGGNGDHRAACAACGTSASAGASFCRECGAALPASRPERRACPSCRTPFRVGAVFCNRCGQRL